MNHKPGPPFMCHPLCVIFYLLPGNFIYDHNVLRAYSLPTPPGHPTPAHFVLLFLITSCAQLMLPMCKWMCCHPMPWLTGNPLWPTLLKKTDSSILSSHHCRSCAGDHSCREFINGIWSCHVHETSCLSNLWLLKTFLLSLI